jgi:hypothetical protein
LELVALVNWRKLPRETCWLALLVEAGFNFFYLPANLFMAGSSTFWYLVFLDIEGALNLAWYAAKGLER